MRGCGTKAGSCRSRCAIVGIEQRAQIVEAFARRQRQRMGAAFAQHFAQSRRAGRRRGAAIAFDVGRRPRRARAACRPDRRARLRRERSRCACRRRRATPAAPASPRCRTSSRESSRRRCRSRRARPPCPDPGAKACSVAGQAFGAGTPYSTALAETKIAMSYWSSVACTRVERRAIRRRQDHDRRKDDRRGAERRQLPRESRPPGAPAA